MAVSVSSMREKRCSVVQAALHLRDRNGRQPQSCLDDLSPDMAAEREWHRRTLARGQHPPRCTTLSYPRDGLVVSNPHQGGTDGSHPMSG